jgi:cytochrome P450
MTPAKAIDLYYDPFDFDIDDDPYPVWKRMREETPLYHNDKYNFYALSRYDDVARELPNWNTYRSGRGTTADILFNNIEIPPGILLFEDPPLHDLHRRLLSRVFTPRRMLAVENLVRGFCERALDPFVGVGGFDVIAHLGAMMPMQTIGYLLGIPEGDQANIRDTNGVSLELASGATPGEANPKLFEKSITLFADYIEWRAAHPSDDLMTDLLQAEVEEPDGTKRRLSRTEVLSYTAMIAGAGNETTARLIASWRNCSLITRISVVNSGPIRASSQGRSRRRCGSSRRHRCRLAMSPVPRRITGKWCQRVPSCCY